MVGFCNAALVGSEWLFLLCVPTAAKNACGDPVMLFADMPSWTLGVELAFYLIAPLIVRSKRRTMLFAGFGLIWQLGLTWLPTPLQGGAVFVVMPDVVRLSYFALPSSWMFFGFGGLAYHFFYRSIRRGEKPGTLDYAYMLVLFGAACTIQHTPLNTAIAVVFVGALPVLFEVTRRNRVDALLGELSYPVYILHYPVALLVWCWRELIPQWGGTLLSPATASAFITIILAYFMVITMERPLDRWRQLLYRRDIPVGTVLPEAP